MRYILSSIIGAAILLAGSVIVLNKVYNPNREFSAVATAGNGSTTVPHVSEKPLAERIKDAEERSSRVKGIYMTAEVANDRGAAATRLRNSIVKLAITTEINAIVIDVKEVCGPEYNETRVKELINELHQHNIWAIARIVAFKDSSQIYAHPEWYLKRATAKKVADSCSNKMYLRANGLDGKKAAATFWQDDKGGYWLDPASNGTHDYLVDFSKKIIDLGFDELQFDYIRFPSDGDMEKALYPAWDGKTPKFKILKSFFAFLHDELKQYKLEIILSADMFGYAAIRAGDVGIGQRLEDIGNSFDYVSFMVYPSHYYSGLNLPADPAHNLPAINYNKNDVRMHPDVTVGRSLQIAQDFLNNLTASSSSATSTAPTNDDPPKHRVKLRPWLEDFFHDADKAAGRPYGAEKVRLQINAAESVENGGWLLWNAANIYTASALKSKDNK